MLIYRVDMNYAQGVGTHVLPHVKPLGLSPGRVVHAALLPGSEKFQAEQPRLPHVPTLPKKPGALKVPKPQLSPPPTDFGRGTRERRPEPAHRRPRGGQPRPGIPKHRDISSVQQVRRPNGSADLESSKPPAPFPGHAPYVRELPASTPCQSFTSSLGQPRNKPLSG